MLGYEPDEMAGLSLRDLTHPDDREVSLKGVDSLMKGVVEETMFEKRYLHRAGHGYGRACRS